MTGRPWRSAFIAALFAWHPLHVESVAWISERKDVLSGLFFMLTLWAYVKYVRQEKVQGLKSKIWFRGALGAFALGLLSKPMLMTVPVVLLLIDFWPLKRVSSSSAPELRRNVAGLIREKTAFFLLAFATGAIAFFSQRASGSMVSVESFGLLSRLANIPVNYLGTTVRLKTPVKRVDYEG